MILADVGGKREVGTQEGRAELGDEFLERIRAIADPLPEIAGEPASSPVKQTVDFQSSRRLC